MTSITSALGTRPEAPLEAPGAASHHHLQPSLLFPERFDGKTLKWKKSLPQSCEEEQMSPHARKVWGANPCWEPSAPQVSSHSECSGLWNLVSPLKKVPKKDLGNKRQVGLISNRSTGI